jgi:hypothetical protein
LQCNILHAAGKPERDGFTFEVDAQVQLDDENKLLFVIVDVKVYDMEKSEVYGEITTSSIFDVFNFNEVIGDNKKGKGGGMQNLFEPAKSVAIGTTRGIMWSTFKGTALHDAILPIFEG